MRSIIIITGLLAAAPAVAGGFNPDRPAFADSPDTASGAKLLTEVGFAASLGDGYTDLTVPGILLRYGILDTLEIRADAPVRVLLPEQGDADGGLGGPGLGIKYRLPTGDDFAVGVVARVGLPFASEGYGPDDIEGLLNANFAWSGLKVITLSGNLGGAWVDVGEDGAVMALGSLAAGLDLAAGIGVYGQGFFTWADAAGLQPGVGAGLTYQAIPDHLQLDLQFDIGVGDKGPDPLVQFGIAHQF